jgi:formylglycine-generating enzyme required for sulfatase activity
VVEASALRNVCDITQLGDLSETDAVALLADGMRIVGVAADHAQALGQAVYACVAGHPYLTQRLGALLADQHLRSMPLDTAQVDAAAFDLLEQDDSLLEHLRRGISDLGLADAARRLLSASQRTSRTDDGVARLDLLGLARRRQRYWAPRNPLLAVAMAEWLGLPAPTNVDLVQAASATEQVALARYLAGLRREQASIAKQLAGEIAAAEQARLQRRAETLADQIAELEKAQPPEPIAATNPLQPTAPTVVPPTTTVRTPTSTAKSVEPAKHEVRTPRTPAAEQHPPGSLVAVPSWLPELVHVPAGPFLMGSSDTDILAWPNEKPQHRLELPEYWIGKTPITNAQFRPFVEGDGYTNQAYWTTAGWKWRQAEKITKPEYWDDSQWNGADYPVVGVSWFEAVAYCRWLSAQIGWEFRLPSEAGWEKAARGADRRIWPWGNTWAAGRANSKEAGWGKTTPVGQYPAGASPYGALDMAGNLCEWCATRWGKPYPYQIEDEWQAAYLAVNDNSVLRGGGWYSEQRLVRASYRIPSSQRKRFGAIGLRVASHTRPGAGS